MKDKVEPSFPRSILMKLFSVSFFGWKPNEACRIYKIIPIKEIILFLLKSEGMNT